MKWNKKTGVELKYSSNLKTLTGQCLSRNLAFGLITFLLWFSGSITPAIAQSTLSNSKADSILNGNYDPSQYAPTTRVFDKDSIIDQIVAGISRDSIQAYLTKLETFGNRNSGSDTLSNVRGIGAARRWIHQKFTAFSASSNNRLEVGYLNFKRNICSMPFHKNVFAVLPGMDTSIKEVLVIEGHMDSRCENTCDTSCYAPGMDDNGSGTVLVMEVARVMSSMAFDRTIIFTTVTGEEQGLNGGEAWVNYLTDHNIKVMACLNNDVVGGVECGLTSSPPSCSPTGSLDSLNLRIFSYSTFNDSNLVSIHKQLARYIKLQQIEEVNPRMPYPVDINLQIRQDRVGRGGDHIPFSSADYAAIRFTSSHEHGDGSGSPGDRQHTTTDALGLDLSVPPDGILDTFLVNFNYLRRNSLTNAINLAMLANAPPIPEPVYQMNSFGNLLNISFHGVDTLYEHKIGVRRNHSPDLYFDTVLSFAQQQIPVSSIFPKGDVQIHIMNIKGGIESLPQTQLQEEVLSIERDEIKPLNCLSVFPNPSNSMIHLKWRCSFRDDNVQLRLIDIHGRIVWSGTVASLSLLKGYGIDVSALPSGLYKLHSIVNEDEVFTESVLIHR